jgi:PPM family protein phosphatase
MRIVRAWSATSVGMVREGNEDRYFHGKDTFAVADGMGGHVAGEVASATALEPISELDGAEFSSPEEATAALKGAITTANTTVFEKAAEDPDLRGMGTTLTALLVRDSRFYLAHVGDSRAYRLRRGEPITRLTTDHTLVQQLIDEHRLSPEEADTHPQRSVITRAIGVEPHVEVETQAPEELLPGDQILLCSDGLTAPVKDDEISRILTQYEDGQAACQALIDAANSGGGPDNITVVLLRVEAAHPAPPAGGSGSNSRSGDTVELGLPTRLAGGCAFGSVTQIRTRQDEDGDFDATKMGYYGKPQGAARPAAPFHRRKRMLLVRLLVAILGLGIVATFGLLLWSRAYFIGEQNGHVAIFRGMPQELSGLVANQLFEETEVLMVDLPPPLAKGIRERSVRYVSLDEARQYVDETPRVQARKTQAERSRQVIEVSPLPSSAPQPAPSGLTPRHAPSPVPTASP